MDDGYAVTSENRGGVEVVTLREGARASAEVAPSLGNNCFAFRTSEAVIEPVRFEDFISRPTSYGIPVLFPFPNRLRDGAFTFRGRRYPINPPRHGLVRDKAWRVTGRGASPEEGAWIRSEIEAAHFPEVILRQFPFPFALRVLHRLRKGALEIEAEAENTGKGPMPVGFGIHPYFRKPDRGSLQAPVTQRWELADSLPTGKRLPVDEAFDLREPRTLAGLMLDDIFTGLTADASGTVRCFLNDEVKGTRTTVEFPVRQFPHLVVYTPPSPRAAICIEPNSCPTDAFNLQARGIEADVTVLEPGERANFQVRIYS